jgi:hypothetical protein
MRKNHSIVFIDWVLLGADVPQFRWEVGDHVFNSDPEIAAVSRVDLAKSEVVNLRLEALLKLLPGDHLGLLSEDPLLLKAAEEDEGPSKVKGVKGETKAFTFVNPYAPRPSKGNILPNRRGCIGDVGDQAGLGLQDKPVITFSIGLKSGYLNWPSAGSSVGPVIKRQSDTTPRDGGGYSRGRHESPLTVNLSNDDGTHGDCP